MNFKVVWDLLRQTYKEWSDDKATRLAAALSYYTVFSLAPLLIIAIAIAGFFFGHDAVQGEVMNQLDDFIGERSAQTIQMAIQSAYKPTTGIVATIVGVVMLLFGASGVFAELQDSLNAIWEVQPKPGRGWWVIIKERFLSFTAVLGVGFLLLVSLLLSAALAAMGKYVGGLLPFSELVLQVTNGVISLGVTILLFALIFKILPDVQIAWKDVWMGAAITAVLFTLGKFLISFYLGKSTGTSAYGAAGAILVVLLWAYYSSLILFFGAEFTQVYANRFGRGVVPSENAERINTNRRAEAKSVSQHDDESFGAHGRSAH